MFQISVQREFCAAHALVIAGMREVVHGHNFHLTVTVESADLDADGLVMDFHALERLVDQIIRPMINADLNAITPFANGLNPSAENIARTIAEQVTHGLEPILPRQGPRPRLASVRLTEAPGCAVTYIP